MERHRQRNLSYDHGVSPIKLRTDTLGDALDATASRVPDQTALVVREQGIRWTWRELAERAETFAAGLLALGLEKGDRVGIWSPNNAEWVLAQYALAKAGLICVTLNPAYRLHEIEYSLNKAGCAALITVRAFRSGDFIALLADLMPELPYSVPGGLHAARVPALRWVIQIGPDPAPGCLAFDAIADYADAAARTRLAAVGETLQFDDPVCIQFTSGTTGTPKGTTLSHHNVINNGAHFGELLRLRDGEKVCSPVPMFHVFGYVGAGVIAAVTGATVVLPAAAFEPLATLQAIHEERCTALYGVPTMFVAELGHPEFNRFDLTCLRTGVMAGAVCPEPLMRQAIERMYMREMVVVFGMTETSPCSTGTLPDDTLARRTQTIGRVFPHVEIKIIDAEGRVVPRGVAGEFCVRGYSVMLGYWGDPTRTSEAIDAAGWMHTGDLVVMNEDGYCSVAGRIKDMIKRGGEAIYPREIEEFLIDHPSIHDVHVFGVAHEYWGEEVCAWISLRGGASLDEAGLREFCKGQISHQKIPVHVRFVDSFPMTGSGKVQKFVMRERMAEELGRAAPA